MKITKKFVCEKYKLNKLNITNTIQNKKAKNLKEKKKKTVST